MTYAGLSIHDSAPRCLVLSFRCRFEGVRGRGAAGSDSDTACGTTDSRLLFYHRQIGQPSSSLTLNIRTLVSPPARRAHEAQRSSRGGEQHPVQANLEPRSGPTAAKGSRGGLSLRPRGIGLAAAASPALLLPVVADAGHTPPTHLLINCRRGKDGRTIQTTPGHNLSRF
ncbi:uncharacterized protein B0I36DRAFT_64688 [Microdochium trichocladiopsis]|uniref:Uncharacterized protein n=1 Tax=Microdochium trichocladiopsis TaxID=1682393 RepID=A0A9P8YD97_9PEZI|nr:uncharacterized protein B0I36DRAFT_64688 [Microdochium trichocladiopsis]KAH7037340.1 hypothetical protein B0I36DRAFT_64688 [Microdochium trichocladiopsis]